MCRSCGLLQKPVTAQWKREISEIYREYALYYQSDEGSEQKILSSSGLGSRSDVLFDRLSELANLPEEGQLLDFGCGTGVTLRVASRRLPRWSLYGYDQSMEAASELRTIQNLKGLYTQLEEAPKEFDLVSLIHVLEHIPHPRATLRAIRARLRKGGVVLIQIPDYGHNPFDLLIADHCSHFTPDQIAALLRAEGYSVTYLSNELIKKEITVVGRRETAGVEGAPTGAVSGPRVAVESALEWLELVKRSAMDTVAAQACAQDPSSVAIFGTSIAAMWLYQYSPTIGLFVDEDRSRVGDGRMPRPVVLPAEVPDGTTILVPLVPEIACEVIPRVARPHLQLVAPPPYPTH